MPQINQLSAVSEISSGDQFPIYSSSNGDARKASASVLLDYVEQHFASPNFVTAFSTPGGSGFTVSVADTSNNAWLIINPAAGYAVGAITLPAVGNCADGQEVMVNISQSVATFTVNLNGAVAVQGAPSVLSANDFFKLRFSSDSSMWYRIS